MGSLIGHYWTLRPFVCHLVKPVIAPPSEHFRALVDDPRLGPVPVTGRLSDTGSDALLVIVHGLGGSGQSFYAVRAAAEAHARGLSSLRLNVRGADRGGADISHAGLTDDIRAALAAPELAHFKHIYVLGYSLGGHLTLRFAGEGAGPRVRAVAAVCAPLDLAAGVHELDRRHRAFYRRHLLGGLKEVYAAVAKRGGGPISLEEAMAIDTLGEWDARIVAPRFGFASAEAYWREATAIPLLPAITVPALSVHATYDPMVLAHTVRPYLDPVTSIEAVHLSEAGHVGFPDLVELAGERGSIEALLIEWLRAEGAGR